MLYKYSSDMKMFAGLISLWSVRGRERSENWNSSNDIFIFSYILWSGLAAQGNWVRADKLHFQRQSDKFHRGRQKEETLVHFMQDISIRPTTTQSLMKFSCAASAIPNEGGWSRPHLGFLIFMGS